MIFTSTPLTGAYLVDPERVEDGRGFFARTWSPDEFASRGLNARLAQCSVSFNRRAGTLRGMHLQRAPFEEAKLVRCTQGAIYDVIVDVRPESPTFRRWFAAELSAENRRMLYIPEGFAHGFQTLMKGSEVFYQVSKAYSPSHAAGIRWNDPAFGIEWPAAADRIMSERDRSFPDFIG